MIHRLFFVAGFVLLLVAALMASRDRTEIMGMTIERPAPRFREMPSGGNGGAAPPNVGVPTGAGGPAAMITPTTCARGGAATCVAVGRGEVRVVYPSPWQTNGRAP